MDYKEYELEDFLADDFFVGWVKNPNPSSDHFWEKWLLQYPEKEKLVEFSRLMVLSAEYKNKQEPSDQDYIQVLEKIHRRKYSRLRNLRSFSPRRWMLHAATVLFLMASTYLMHETLKETPKDQQNIVIAPIVREVPFGQKVKIKLPDGTSLRLNSGSKFWYYTDFNERSRDVFLEGEGYFEVVGDTAKPFRVFSGDIVTKVIGTEFNVRAYPEEATITVAVAEGKVATYNKADIDLSIPYLPGDMAIYDLTTGKVTRSNFDNDLTLGWEKDLFVIKDQEFNEVLKALEKWYGATFIVDNSITVKGKYSGKFNDESLENVIKGLGFSSKIDVSQKQDTVWIKPKH